MKLVPARASLVLAVLLLAAFGCRAQSNPLPPDKAFRFSVRALNPQTVEARFTIADGYYLYRDKVRFVVEPAAAALVAPELPPGKVKHDDFFGAVETYRGNLTVNLDLKGTLAGQQVTVQAESQGCADVGICYPPNIQRVTLSLPAATAVPSGAGEPARKSWFN